MATEPDLVDGQEQSLAGSESNEISREDTMVEHSVVVNEESPSVDADYLQALESVKFDMVAIASGPVLASGEVDLVGNEAGSGESVLKNNYMGFTEDDDAMIESTLIQMRNRIRSGLPLSH